MHAVKATVERVEWSRRYAVAIRRFLSQEKAGSLLPAARLGRRAVDLGLEALDVARIHEQALSAAAARKGSPGNAGPEVLQRAAPFFKETLVPIEATHRAARAAHLRIGRLTRRSRRRATAASVSDGQVERAIVRREAAEADARARATRRDALLAKALRLQQWLRERIRGILAQQEGDRKRISAELRDGIAQALLAIDLGLLTLKTAGHVNTEETEKCIADAQRVLRELRTKGRLPGGRRVQG